ncbi:PspC domain-containing protein [Dermacoccus abyssi]
MNETATPNPREDERTGSSASSATSASTGDSFDRFVEKLRDIDLRRDTGGGWLGGVCAGVGLRLGVAPLLVRAVAILLVLSGVGLVVYLLAWSLVPDRVVLDEARRGDSGMPMVVLVLTALALIVTMPWGFDFEFLGNTGPVISLVALGALAFVVIRRGRKNEPLPHAATYAPTPAPGGSETVGEPPVTGYGFDGNATSSSVPFIDERRSAREQFRAARAHHQQNNLAAQEARRARNAERRARRRRTRLPFAALLLLAGLAIVPPALGLVGGVTTGGETALPWLVSGSLAVVSLGALFFALRGYRVGVLSLLVVPLIAVSITFASLHSAGYSSRTSSLSAQPTTLAATQSYDAGMGTSTIDLTRVDVATMPEVVDVNARLTAGRLRVEVPRGVKVELTSVTHLGYIGDTDGAGQVFYGAGGSSGTEPTRTTLGSGNKTIRLKTDVGIGDVFVHVRSQAPSKTPGSSS